MQITATWVKGEEVAVEVDPECRTLAALKALLQDALPDVDVETVRLEVGGRELTDDDGVCGLEAGSVVKLSVTAAALAVATLRKEGHSVSGDALSRVITDGDVRLCGLYLDAGVWTPGELQGPTTPLHIACISGRTAIIELLLDHGCAVDKDCDQRTALHIICECGPVEIAKLLLDGGCAIEEMSRHGDTPLHIACRHGQTAIVELLLSRGCAIEARTGDEYTPLHVACWHGHAASVGLLLSRGCAIDGTADDYTNPYLVPTGGHLAIVELLLNHGCQRD